MPSVLFGFSKTTVTEELVTVFAEAANSTATGLGSGVLPMFMQVRSRHSKIGSELQPRNRLRGFGFGLQYNQGPKRKLYGLRGLMSGSSSTGGAGSDVGSSARVPDINSSPCRSQSETSCRILR